MDSDQKINTVPPAGIGWEFLPGQGCLPPFPGASYWSRIGLRIEAQSS
jgi:hypothetical protein